MKANSQCNKHPDKKSAPGSGHPTVLLSLHLFTVWALPLAYRASFKWLFISSSPSKTFQDAVCSCQPTEVSESLKLHIFLRNIPARLSFSRFFLSKIICLSQIEGVTNCSAEVRLAQMHFLSLALLWNIPKNSSKHSQEHTGRSFLPVQCKKQ